MKLLWIVLIDRDIVGVVTMPTMTARMSKAAISGTDPVSRVMSKTFKTVSGLLKQKWFLHGHCIQAAMSSMQIHLYMQELPYSGKFSPKPGPIYCRKNSPDLFSRSLDWAKLKFKPNLYLTP